jgi:long-chain acyl-CoA synthetase
MRGDPNVTADDIIKFCATQLTSYKVPKQIEFRTDLPKTNVGKILRRQMRDQE